MAALRWPGTSAPPATLWGAPYVAWSEHMERPGPLGKACRYPEWTAAKEAKDGDSSVSSGRLSGSSGGHESCAPPHGPWKERPPQVLASPRQPRESNPRLEQLRDKIRAQAQWQASCASLGTSAPSSASHLYQTSMSALRSKARKMKRPPPAPAYSGLGVPSAIERGVEDKAVPGRGREPSRVSQRQASVPPEKTKRTKSGSCKREKAPQSSSPRRDAKDKGDSKNIGTAESSPVRPRPTSPASVHSDPQVPANMPNLASCDQQVTIQSAMAILRELRQQIQAGLELAQDHQLREGRERRPSTPRLWDLAGRRHQGPCRAPDGQDSFSKSPRATVEGMRPSLERAGSFSTGQNWSTLARWESYPQRAWSAQGRGSSCRRPGSSPERRTYFPPRPWSASAGQRARATCEDWEASAQGPGSPLERPWSASFMRRAGTPCKARGSLLPPSGANHTWPRSAQSGPLNTLGKESEARPPPPCPKLRGFLGHPYSSESLREFMRQKTLARRQQALEEKALAMRALELRDQRLRDVYRKQREAVLGKAGPGQAIRSKAFPVVSQTTPGIVTFVPHSAASRDLEAPGSLGSPVLQWSKVTSGMVLGDQEAPGSFCLCLNRALNHAETLETGGPQEGWDGAPLPMSASSSLGPPKLQDLTSHHPHPGLCIYLDPEEAERLGTPGPLHFRYKQARLQALETMASILKQRIDVLTAKLLRSEAADTLGDLVLDPPPSCPSTVPTANMPAAPACPGGLVPDGGGGAPWERADVQARVLLSPTCFPEGKPPRWSPGWEARRSVSLRGLLASKPRGFMEDECSELDKRLARNTASFQAFSPFAGSSRRVPALPDPTCSSLWLEERPSVRGAGLVTPWTAWSCGQWEPGQLRSGHLADIQQKSLSFLQALKLDQQRQGQVLALLRQWAEKEVWETQKALDELLFRRQLQRLTEKHATQARPGTALELERLQVCGDLDPKTSWSMVTAGPRSHPPSGADAAAPSRGPEGGWELQAGKSASAEPTQEGKPDRTPSQLPLARLYPWHHPTHQTLEQKLQEEELRAQHQAALLRLREKALEEKTFAELAWLEHQRGCLGSEGNSAALVALAEKQQQVLSNLEQEQREIRYLRNTHLFSHRERTLLAQQHRDTLSVQRPLARLQQDPQAPTGLPQSAGPEVQAARDGGSEASQRPEGPVQGSSCPPTPHRPGSPTSHRPRRSPESPRVPHLPTKRQDGTSPRTSPASDSHLQPPRPAWGEDSPTADGWPDARGRLVERGSRVDLESGEQPCVPQPSLQQATSLDIGWPQGPAFPTPAGKAEGSVSAAQLRFQRFQRMKEPPLGGPQANPSRSAEEETQALMESHAWSVQGVSQQVREGGGPCGPQEASQVVEGSTCQAGAELGLHFADSPVRKPLETESWWLGEQRTGTCWQEDACSPFWQEAARVMPVQAACPAPAAAEEAAPPTPLQGHPLPHLPSCPALGSPCESAPGTCSGSPVRSRAPSSVSSLSCPSLQEFQKVSAVLVQLSESSVSLLDWEAGDTPNADLIWTREPSPGDSWGLHRGRGREAGERPEGSVASPVLCFPAVWGGPESAPGLLNVPSPGSGSELSEASSQVWDEEDLPESGAGAQPASGHSLPAQGSSDLENGGAPQMTLPCPGVGQRASGTSGSNTGKAKRTSPEAACTALPPKTSSSSDLDLCLSFPSGSSASEGADSGKEGETESLQASAGCPEGPWDADLSPSTNRKPLQALPEVLGSPQAPPGDPSGLASLTAESQAPGCGGSRAPPVPEEARPRLASGVLPEILSPVDEVLSYGSADLPSSTHRGAPFPLPPPTLPAESGATPSPHSEDFPSPPQDTMSPVGSLGPPEDASINSSELPSLSEEGLPEALSLGPQESGLCLWEGTQGGSLGDELGESSSVAGDQAVGGQWSEPGCLGSPLCVGAGDDPVQPPTLSRELTAGDTGLSGTGQGDPAPALDVGPCTDVPRGESRGGGFGPLSAHHKDRVRHARSALRAGLAGSSLTEELAGVSRVSGPPTAAAGQSWGRPDF